MKIEIAPSVSSPGEKVTIKVYGEGVDFVSLQLTAAGVPLPVTPIIGDFAYATYTTPETGPVQIVAEDSTGSAANVLPVGTALSKIMTEQFQELVCWIVENGAITDDQINSIVDKTLTRNICTAAMSDGSEGSNRNSLYGAISMLVGDQQFFKMGNCWFQTITGLCESMPTLGSKRLSMDADGNFVENCKADAGCCTCKRPKPTPSGDCNHCGNPCG